jgi:hypothetical protein
VTAHKREPKRTCDRCVYPGRLYWLGTRMLCSACWDVVASEEARAAGLRTIDLRAKRAVT